MEINEKIRGFIEENLVVFEDEATFSDDDNIFELGFVNSLFAMRMVSFIESEFDIEVENDDLDLKNFSSVNRVVDFINRKI